MVHTFNSTDYGEAAHQIESGTEPASRDCANDEKIGVGIVEAVSTVSGVDPCEFDTRLYDVIDPDALDRVIRSGAPDVQVSFRFGPYQVSVFGSGEIAVTEAAAGGPEPSDSR